MYLRHEGYRPLARAVTVTRDQVVRLDVTLEKLDLALPPRATGEAAPSVDEANERAAPAPAARSRGLPWLALDLGAGALVVAGAVALALAVGLGTNFADQTRATCGTGCILVDGAR